MTRARYVHEPTWIKWIDDADLRDGETFPRRPWFLALAFGFILLFFAIELVQIAIADMES